MNRQRAALGTAIAFLLVCFAYRFIDMTDTRIHVLRHPLRIASAARDEWYLLPAGTTLYYDDSMPEGFDRYRIYLNVEGGDLDLSQVSDRYYIAPLSAYPIEGEDILRLIRSYPVNKEDLIGLLKAKPLTAEDAREIIDFLQNQIVDSR
jgi:hypothetical protein